MKYLIMSLLLLLASCTSTKYVPVERVRTEYIAADTTAVYNRLTQMFESMREREARSDSLIDRSNETVTLNEQGDTVRCDRERVIYRATGRERDLEKKTVQQDSIINSLRLQLASVKQDSVPVPYPVEKKLTKWERTKIDWGGWSMAVLAAVVVVALGLWKRRS